MTKDITADRNDISGAGTSCSRIAIIEDDRILLALLKKLVSRQPDFELVGAWSSSQAAIVELPATEPDIVIVDLELPVVSGDACIRELSKTMPATAFVVLTVHGTGERVFSALRAGANGYLLKSAPPAEILAGLRAARDGGVPLSPAVARMVIEAFQESFPYKREAAMPLPNLTPREHQLLQLLASGKVPKEAAAELDLSYETVRGYLKKIYQKLHVRSRTEAVVKYISSRPPTTEQ